MWCITQSAICSCGRSSCHFFSKKCIMVAKVAEKAQQILIKRCHITIFGKKMADAQPSKQKKGKLFCLIGYFESVYSILLGVWGAELTNVTNVHLNLTLNFMYICKYTGDYSQACVWEYLGIWHLLAVDYPWNLWAVVCCSLEKLVSHSPKHMFLLWIPHTGDMEAL